MMRMLEGRPKQNAQADLGLSRSEGVQRRMFQVLIRCLGDDGDAGVSVAAWRLRLRAKGIG